MLDKQDIAEASRTLHGHWRAGTKLTALDPSMRPRDRIEGCRPRLERVRAVPHERRSFVDDDQVGPGGMRRRGARNIPFVERFHELRQRCHDVCRWGLCARRGYRQRA